MLTLLFQVRYTGLRDRPYEERRMKFQNDCREGHADIVSLCFIDDITFLGNLSNLSFGNTYPLELMQLCSPALECVIFIIVYSNSLRNVAVCVPRAPNPLRNVT